jgi:hypothetical protein
VNKTSSFADFVAAFWRRVFAASSVPQPSLGIFRWVYGLFTLAFETPFSAWIDRAPRAFFDPPLLSPAYLFRTFPPPPFFTVLDSINIVALCAATVGLRTRTATAILLLGKLIANSFRFSFGKIDHDILLNVVLACMLLADWGTHFSLDSYLRSPAPGRLRQASQRTPLALGLFAIAIAFGMFSAGLEKAVYWIDFNMNSSGTLSWLLPNLYSLRRGYLLAPFAIHAPRIVLELADYAAPAFEISGLIALLASRTLWMAWLLVACFFHLGNALVLNISFADYALMYTIFCDWSRIGRRRFTSDSRLRPFPLALGCCAVCVLGGWHLVTRLAGGGTTFVPLTDPAAVEAAGLYLSIPVVLVSVLLLFGELRAAVQ